MEEVSLPEVINEIAAAFETNDFPRVAQLLYPALDQFPGVAPLWFHAGNHLFRTHSAALAALCYEKCSDLETNPHVLANLAACYRRQNLNDQGIAVCERALAIDPGCLPALINLGGMAVNEGNPGPGIEALERVLPLSEDRAARWNLGLLYLEAGRFAEGFDLYAGGRGRERQLREYPVEGQPEPELLEPKHPRAGKTLVVWGEQGIGDELMFATILPEAQKDFGRVIFDCHPRLTRLHATTYPGVELRPTRKITSTLSTWAQEEGAKIDYKAPLGDLARLYRRDLASFQNGRKRVYVPHYAEAADYRASLKRRANGRPLVGLAMRGGVITTARTMRTVKMEDLEPLFDQTDACFVSLDYEDIGPLAAQIHERYGPDRFTWLPSILYTWDYDHTAALVLACDMVVTVCQSVAHLAALVGAETRVMVPTRVAWRYGLRGEEWYWYPRPGVRLYRQATDGVWKGVVERLVADIRSLEEAP